MKHNMWYNLWHGVLFWFKLIIRWFTEGQEQVAEKAMEDLIKGDEKINKLMGLPPPDRFAEKNPMRFM